MTFTYGAHLHGVGYPRQPSLEVILAGVTFPHVSEKFNEPFTWTRGRDNSGGWDVSPQLVGPYERVGSPARDGTAQIISGARVF